MIYTSPKGTVYKFKSTTGLVSIAVKSDDNTLQLRGYHDNTALLGDRPTTLSGDWTVVQNVHMLTQEEHLKLVKALESYLKHNRYWTSPNGFGANFGKGRLIVWPKGQEGTDLEAYELGRRLGSIKLTMEDFYSIPVQEYPKNTTYAEIRMRQYKSDRLASMLVKDFCSISSTESGRFNSIGTNQSNTGKSDGSKANYYDLPSNAKILNDLIQHRHMNHAMGELFCAAYRYGLSSHSDQLRDAKKIKFYIEAEIKRLEQCA